MDQINVAGVLSVPLIVAVVALFRVMFGLDSRFAPVAAVLVGIGLAVAYHYAPGHPVITDAIDGLTIGLTASGLYSGTKAVLQAHMPVSSTDVPTQG